MNGAGVLLLEKYNTRDINKKIIRTGYSVILFHDKKRKVYTECGGNIDPGETMEICAQRELKEESLGLFRINISKLAPRLKSIDSYQGKYTCFLAYVKGPQGIGIRSSDYDHNKKFIETNKSMIPDCWRETDRMTRIYLDDIKFNHLNEIETSQRDVYGKSIKLYHRTANILKKLIQTKTNISSIYQIHLNRSKNGTCDNGIGDKHKNSKLWNDTKEKTKCLYFY